MGPRQRTRPCDGFTLIEVLVVVAIIGVLLMLAAPSFRELIEMRRLRGTHAQVMTDVQFARSEAVSRQQPVVMRIGVRGEPAVATCYVIYTCNDGGAFNCDCECGRGAGNACNPSTNPSTNWAEIRTVDVASDSGLTVTPQREDQVGPPVTNLAIQFDPRSGGSVHQVVSPGAYGVPSESVGNINTTSSRLSRTLRAKINLSGRPSECSPSSARVADTPACDP